MAKRSGKYICNRCGCKIDTANDLDCTEIRMFQSRSITERGSGPEEKFTRVDAGTKLHFCGKCNQMLMSHYVFGHEYKKPPIAEELVRCEDCIHRLMSDCPLCYIEKQKLCFIDMRGDFFCGYGERRADNG